MFPRKTYTVTLPGGRALELGPRTLVMGILNVTPDSFADGGRYLDPERAADAALELEAAGADIVDIGGESTRPGADPLPADEELARVIPVLKRISGRVKVPLSIDTYKAPVARAALDEGAAIVNDISGLRYDAALAPLVAARGAALVLMHSRGRSGDMYRDAVYRDLLAEVKDELESSLRVALAANVARDAIILDPGIGFAKRAEHSYAALAGLPELAALDRPILVGPSRKSFLQLDLGDMPASARDWATAAATASAVLLGAHIVRVHAVAEMLQVVRIADRIRGAAASHQEPHQEPGTRNRTKNEEPRTKN